MAPKRLQGRPPRGSSDGGREKLIEGTRSVVRSRVELNISRQEVARLAGMTPAMVTYYFPRQADLIEAATAPIIQHNVLRLSEILNDDKPFRERLVDMVDLFIAFCFDNGRILDVFIEYVDEMSDGLGVSLVHPAFQGLILFFERGKDEKAWQIGDPTFALLAIWGMCKMVAEPPRIPAIAQMSEHLRSPDVRRAQSGLIVDLVLNGISGRPVAASEPRRDDGSCE